MGEQKGNRGQIREYRGWLAGYETAGFYFALYGLLMDMVDIIIVVDKI